MRRVVFLLSGAYLFLRIGYAHEINIKDFKKEFNDAGINGYFVLYNEADNQYVKYNDKLCDKDYLPASTFNIANSVIVLEEGILKDISQIIKWDGDIWPSQSWNKDLSLPSTLFWLAGSFRIRPWRPVY